ncbi:histidine phosphatase family protein [Ectobacillus sp. JY-23]|uniref:histidine phosphatase family protein n=1 Tax=Ectobacillus sp. JY-23 TaxID=2933872 RepID=UPI001FF4E7C2|nr:histidine phosphatase family protein [Ectobacillus sp. JY-23]UOY92309.1 histidine phosphatase family protein [Ectobacillus sp. JY-23]
MLTLYITRHGETEWNVQKRMQGWLDSELTDKGINHAKSLGVRLKDIDFTAVYTSTSGRTQLTAKLICEGKDVPTIHDENLQEINVGDWEGKTHSDIQKHDPSEYDAFWNAPKQYKSVSGETFYEVWERALRALKRITKEQHTGNILIVTHSVVIKCLLAIFKNASIEQLWDPPYIHDTSLTMVEVDEVGYRVLLEGDLSHKEPITPEKV